MFRTFARFEYALKAAGFNNRNGDAKPDWSAFARPVPDVFGDPQDEALREAVDYILAHPPKKQILVDGLLAWRGAPPRTNLKSEEVLVYVRRVRDNLFHGGKFNGHWFEPRRSHNLIRHALVILRACLRASPDVRQAYDNEG